jgi:hypothetical protein
MPFSAGSVPGVYVHPEAGSQPRLQSHTIKPQSGQQGQKAGFVAVHGPTTISDADVVIRDQGKNMMNLYGIPGSQGPAINIPRVARAIRGHELPIVTIDRRVDPQYSNRDLGMAAHQEQGRIPVQETDSSMLTLNMWTDRETKGIKFDPEWLGRHGFGRSRLAGGQQSGAGMQNTTRSSAAIDESPAPTRIPHVWNDALSASAGILQYAFTQQNYRKFMPHIWMSRVQYPTRGIRSVSGVGAQMSTASRVRIPAIFVPSAVG